MSNEEIVLKIQKGINESENLQLLYDRNLPLIRSHVKPYFAFDDAEDLMQQAFLGLWEATKHFEPEYGCKFMSYAAFWIRQSVQRYIVNCSGLIHIPSDVNAKIVKYKRAVNQLEQELNREPTMQEIAAFLGCSVGEAEECKTYSVGIGSIDCEIQGAENLTVAEIVADEFDLEETALDNVYKEACKKELWKIIETYTDEKEYDFVYGVCALEKTFAQLAKEYDISLQRAREIYHATLRKLRRGNSLKDLKEKFEITEMRLYSGGLTQYKLHDFTSCVEDVAIRREELRQKYANLISG